jgi:type I restriction enzyme R subunit
MKQVADLASKLVKGESITPYPAWADTPGRRALADFDWPDGVDPECIHGVIQLSKDHGWTESRIKERALTRALSDALPDEVDPVLIERLIALLKEHHEFR